MVKEEKILLSLVYFSNNLKNRCFKCSNIIFGIATLFNKIGDNKGIFRAGMDQINDKNCKDPKEAEEIKKTWQEYTELYKTALNDPDNHDGVITILEPDILECKVKWALGSITSNKASGGDGIPVELFKILKVYAVSKVLHSIYQQI